MADQMIPIFDGHNDTLLEMADTGRKFYERSDTGHIDAVRAREGGLAGGFFAVFVPSPKEDDPDIPLTTGLLGCGIDGVQLSNEWGGPSLAYAQQFAHALTAKLLRLEAGGGPGVDENGDHPGTLDELLSIVHFAEDITENVENGTLSAILHFEGAEMIDDNFYALETFHAAGLRSLGLVWSRSNIYGHGVPFAYPSSPDTGPGLTDAGKALVTACNELGIMVDVSHLNEKGFWDLAEITASPIVATHSNAHALCQSSRNLTDKQLDAIRDSDGIVGVNFNVPFLRPDGGRDADMPLSIMADHVDYLVNRLGIDRVALGSDFDGALMPADLSDCSKLPNLVAVLRDRGYDDDALRKIGYQNWVRVLTATWGM
ncbi:MAG TPA: dipeptidase [Thermomicrobiales bacterium]|nr:dipeptidase [Thermomicrobiales bacterium]